MATDPYFPQADSRMHAKVLCHARKRYKPRVARTIASESHVLFGHGGIVGVLHASMPLSGERGNTETW